MMLSACAEHISRKVLIGLCKVRYMVLRFPFVVLLRFSHQLQQESTTAAYPAWYLETRIICFVSPIGVILPPNSPADFLGDIYVGEG